MSGFGNQRPAVVQDRDNAGGRPHTVNTEACTKVLRLAQSLLCSTALVLLTTSVPLHVTQLLSTCLV